MLIPALLAVLSSLANPVPLSLEEPSVLVLEGDYEKLHAEYRSAAARYKNALRRASKEERKELRKSPPGKEFFARFEQLANAGDGRALLWTVKNIKLAGMGIREGRDARVEKYRLLVAQHIEAEWFGDVLSQLPRDRKLLGERELIETFERASKSNASRDVQAQALFMLSMELRRSEDPARQKRADEVLARVVEEYSDTKFANNAENDLFTATRLSVGKLAPDFEGKTIDGYAFKLSDYRGKVVLVDFYGFW